MTAPSPNTRLWQAARLSLTVPYEQLHRHRTNDYVGCHSPAPHCWAELCGALSNLVRFAALRAVSLRLDVADADRFWWEVRERWVLSAVRGRLARCLVLQLPELTADVDTMRPYQFLPPPPNPLCSSTTELSGSGDDASAVDPTTPENRSRYSVPAPHKPLWKSAATSPPPESAEEAMRNTEYPSTSTTPSPETPPPDSGSESPGGVGGGVPPIPFMRLERYQRRRWSREPVGDGVQARLEFFNPREHKVLSRERRREKIRGLFRGLLMM